MTTFRDTQITSWCSLQSSLDTRLDQVYEIIRRSGGATGFEVAEALGLPLHCVSGRITDLCGERGGWVVEDSGLRRVNPGSGKSCIVWGCRK
jgi:hypothetical protein